MRVSIVSAALLLLASPALSVTIEGEIKSRSSKYEVDKNITKWIEPMMDRKLKDARSARLRSVLFVRKSSMRYYLCGEVNAKNSFGAYAGWVPFYLLVKFDGEGTLDGWDIGMPSGYEGGSSAFTEDFKYNCEL